MFKVELQILQLTWHLPNRFQRNQMHQSKLSSSATTALVVGHVLLLVEDRQCLGDSKFPTKRYNTFERHKTFFLILS